MKTYFLLFFLAFFAFFNACEVEGDCFNQIEVPVTNIEMPDSAKVDSNVNIDITYVVYNNCHKSTTVREYAEVDTLSLHIFATYEGCDCPDIEPDSTITASFSSKVPRRYIFRALMFDGTILQDTLTIYAPEAE